jgi:glutamine amidotransferase
MLSICLGMQLLFSQNEEFGLHDGLGFFRGRVRRLHDTSTDGQRVKVPHVGWAALEQAQGQASWDGTFLEGLAAGESMYFVHSYVPFPEDASVTTARMVYGGHAYSAVVEQGNLIGCQFHPEKSGEAGLHLLRTFLRRTTSALVSMEEPG